MQSETLKEIGLNNTEAKVYLALLELGSALAGEITKKSNVNRTNVYDALERLIEKGLVSFVLSANRKIFEAVNPERLNEILNEKKKRLNDLMPELKQKYKESISEENATIFKGKKGINSLMEDVLKEKKQTYAYGAEGKFSEMFPAYFNDWNKRRAELKINLQMIYNEKIKSKKKKDPNITLTKMKFLPKEYDFPSTIIIYGNKVATIVWSELPYGFLINSKEVAKSNMNFFNILWKSAKY